MRILYLYDGAWPKGATRVRKETRALAAAGHQVHLIARNAEAAAPRMTESWMEVWRLPRIRIAGLRYALNFPLFVNPLWLWRIRQVIRAIRPDLILVCDLPLAPCAVWFGWLKGITVHYDMGEIYPEFLRSLRQLERQGPLKRLIRSPVAAEWLERAVLKRVACTYVVSVESRDRCIELGVAPNRLVLVGNTPEELPDIDHPCPVPPEIQDLVAARKSILLFVGILIADRGVLDVIRGLPGLLGRNPETVLVVVGDGPAMPDLVKEVKALHLETSVRFVGWKQLDELKGYYGASHVGLLPFRDSPHIRLTLANKLFDYMAAGLPVVASDLPSTRRIVLDTEAGVLHEADNPQDFARVAALLLADSALRQRLGRNGRLAVEGKYSWSEDARRLNDAVERVR